MTRAPARDDRGIAWSGRVAVSLKTEPVLATPGPKNTQVLTHFYAAPIRFLAITTASFIAAFILVESA